jgi:hypothetical protein
MADKVNFVLLVSPMWSLRQEHVIEPLVLGVVLPHVYTEPEVVAALQCILHIVHDLLMVAAAAALQVMEVKVGMEVLVVVPEDPV